MVAAAVVWSTAGVLQREVEAGPATQVADRAVFAGLTILLAVVVTERGRTVTAITGLGRWGLAAVLPWALASSLFILSLNYTTVANVLFWQATAPMLAALLAWLFLSERIALRTWLAMGLAGVGVLLMVGGGIEGGLVAAVIPFVMTIAFAIVIVLSRRRSDISLAPAAFLSQIVVVVCLGPFAAMGSASGSDWLWLALLGAIVASGIVLMTIAAQRIPASEIALITLIQIVLGPLLVWLAYREEPPLGTLLGGVVIMAAVVVQAVGDLRRHQPVAVAAIDGLPVTSEDEHRPAPQPATLEEDVRVGGALETERLRHPQP
jgi:drug/metabolite transporter (DMT)-like permease